MTRNLSDFLEGFNEYASVWNAPPLYVKAAGVWTVSTAVFRQVAMQIRGNVLCPNLFLMMVGGPATGKSQATKAIQSIFGKAIKNSSFIPSSVTRAAMEDYMNDNLQTRLSPDGGLSFSNECIGLSDEMQGILPDQDLGHLTLYNQLYDTPNVHKARTRTHGEVALQEPYCSILTGAQPSFLATTMPENAWGMGFMSRMIMVFDTPKERVSAFDAPEVNSKLKAHLIEDLKQIHSLFGWMKWTPEAIKFYETWWVDNKGAPVPTAKRLAMGYNGRRELHFFKLAMTMSLSRSDNLIVEIADAARALQLLIEIENRSKHIFAEMANSGSMVAINDVIDAVRAATAEGRSMAESDLIHLLMQRFPSTQVHSIIDNLVHSSALRIVATPGMDSPARGFRKFVLGAGAVI